MIRHLYRYPVKGLSGEPMDQLELLAGKGIPLDRAIAVARRPGLFDPAAPVALTKDKFLMLMRDEALALLQTRYDEQTATLSVTAPAGATAHFALNQEEGRMALSAFLRDHVGTTNLDPVVVSAPGHQFTDISVVSPEKMRAVSLINLASVTALANAAGEPIDHRRFRANIYFDGAAPWEERDWLEREVQIGDVVMRITMHTRRCAATQVNPATGIRDVNVPAVIKRHFGHFDMGVYGEVLRGGTLESGMTLRLAGS